MKILIIYALVSAAVLVALSVGHPSRGYQDSANISGHRTEVTPDPSMMINSSLSEFEWQKYAPQTATTTLYGVCYRKGKCWETVYEDINGCWLWDERTQSYWQAGHVYGNCDIYKPTNSPLSK